MHTNFCLEKGRENFVDLGADGIIIQEKLKSTGNLLISFFSRRYTRTNILSFFDIIP